MAAASPSNPRKRKHVSAISKNIKKLAAPATTSGTAMQNHSGCVILSRLIDSNIISDHEPVFYRKNKDGPDMKVGKLTRHGIHCVCCGETFVASKFEAHAGSGRRRPNAHLFLGDGRSVMDCHMEFLNKQECDSQKSKECETACTVNYDVCEICGDAGQLTLCGGCDCGFHTGCLHLDQVPKEDWYCSSCLCGRCGQSIIIGSHREQDRVSCAQCRRSFHGHCAKQRHHESQGTWFCQESCKKVFMNLRRLVGKEVRLDDDGDLSWILLRSSEEEGQEPSSLRRPKKKPKKGSEVDIERYLPEALKVLQECFNEIVDAATGIELLPQTVFNRKSEVRRVDCSGFYTMVLLKKGQHVACVATLRIHGARAAEMPFVATRSEFQQQGMCKALMKTLEKMLREKVGVQELVLPSISQMVGTWMGSFGFEHVTPHASKQIISQVQMMSFPGTTLLHKTLIGDYNTTNSAGQQQRPRRPQVGLMRPRRLPITTILALEAAA